MVNGRLDTVKERITDLEHRDTKKVPRMCQRKEDGRHEREVNKWRKSEKI